MDKNKFLSKEKKLKKDDTELKPKERALKTGAESVSRDKNST